MSVDSKKQANDLLRWGIGVLRGEHGWKPKVQRKYRLILAQDLVVRLSESGFMWQAKTLLSWVHRCMRGDFDQEKDPCRPERPDLSPRERRETS